MKKVLFLAYLFPPIANSGTQRPWKFAKYLADYGWQPTVITAADLDGHHIDSGLSADLPANVDVVRVPMLNDQIGATLAALAGGGRLGKRVGDAISWRIRQRRRSPDLYALWKPTVMRAAMKIFHERGFDAIYATGFPWTALIAGAELSQATGRPLVADFRDLWAGDPMFPEGRPSHAEEVALERSVVEQATTVVGASASIGRQLAATHPSVSEEKFVTIHNGFDAEDFTEPRVRPTAQRFRIVYTGVWKEGYNPAELYDTIDWIRRSRPALLENAEVITAGFAPGEARRRGLSAYIEERGVVSHQAAVALMRSADILFLSHTSPDRQWAVPGKLYEYLASQSPVLALTSPNNEMAQIIRAVGGGIAVPHDDPGTLLDVIGEACRAGKLNVPERQVEALNLFERRQLTAKLAAVLDEAATHAPMHHTALRMDAGSSSMLATRSS
ncbi:MAG TPA: glycosyltransferase [Vicinamibacterales bacterium]|nr:glycosyltransferase [Vicinamibacterales bacterium]